LIEGPFRPFRVSPAKAAVLVDMVADLRAFAEKYKHFVKRYGKKTPDRIPTPEEMAIIAKYVKDPHTVENLSNQPLTVEQK
jgi:hypothetical protein